MNNESVKKQHLSLFATLTGVLENWYSTGSRRFEIKFVLLRLKGFVARSDALPLKDSSSKSIMLSKYTELF